MPILNGMNIVVAVLAIFPLHDSATTCTLRRYSVGNGMKHWVIVRRICDMATVDLPFRARWMHGSLILISVVIDFLVPNIFSYFFYFVRRWFAVRFVHQMIYVNLSAGQNGGIDDVPAGKQQSTIFRSCENNAMRTQSDGEQNGENRIIFLVSLVGRKSSVTNSIPLPHVLLPRVILIQHNRCRCRRRASSKLYVYINWFSYFIRI